MTEQSVTPIDPQEEIQTVLHGEPSSIAEALDLDVRLGALSGWVNDRKRAVSGWVQTKAEARLAEDGAAPTWRLDDGTVLLTNPTPTPRIADQEAFARWYVANLLDRDPDEIPEAGYRMQFDDRVLRRVVARADSSDLLAFLDDLARADDNDYAAALAQGMANAVSVDEEWLVGESTLDDLIAGKIHTADKDRPRLIVDADRLVVVDRQTGEAPVPGTQVAPPNKRTVQMRPSTDAKGRVRGELDRLLGVAALGE